METIVKLASENGILILSKSSCCLSYAVQMLFQEIGARPLVYDVDEDPLLGKEIERALVRMGSGGPLPAVFVGGEFVGSTNEVMSLHLSGELVPLLRPYHEH
ncbi:Monothiol glutaredoxin-S9 [Striga hermonthica]|uniref:Monothiol glutaredoxin-S9 n=1 Tax=Striga hermonthica TaxID=68872 RepID=A0A9N7NG26_STRHE|nr:Monothiol glutaredoxin-S9 [Striga hermonthica]